MFREYTAMAEMGIIELGGSEGTAWIALREPWIDLPDLPYLLQMSLRHCQHLLRLLHHPHP